MNRPRVYVHGVGWMVAWFRYLVLEVGFDEAEGVEDADVVIVPRGVMDGEFGEKVVVRQGEWSVGHTLGVARAKCEASASARDGLRPKS